ncbi:MAG: hypothetical protein JWP85_1596 [Rhodoglobus sp.]|nr:hypothetical protein [Rhodoglobus sp.]
MTILLEKTTPIVRQNPTAMSVDDRNFDLDEEVKTMTVTTAFDRLIDAPAGRRARPHGVDRLVMRLSLAMLIWARERAERDAVSHDERVLRISQVRATQRREHDAALRAARVR